MTSLVCVLCSTMDRPKSAQAGSNTCLRCHGRILGRLADIEEWYSKLDVRPGVGPESGRRSPGFGSRPPLNLSVLAALDYATVPTDEDPVRSVLGSVHGMARWIREEREMTEPTGKPTLVGELTFVRTWLDWCTAQPWIDDLDADIRELHGFLRSLLPVPRPARPIGRCPNLVRDRECGHTLFAPSEGDAIDCRGCGREWPREEWLRLAVILEAG